MFTFGKRACFFVQRPPVPCVHWTVFCFVYHFWYTFLAFLNLVPYLCRKSKIMAVLNFTSREFRSQQAHVFDLADKGEKIIIRRSRKQAYTLVPIEDDDLVITSELQMRIEEARAEIKAGKCTTLRSQEDIDAYFEAL